MRPYYDHGGITIYHGDCRDMLPTLIQPDVILTDPPYGIAWRQHGGGKTGKTRAMRNIPAITGDSDTSARDYVIACYPQTPSLYFGSFRAPFPAGLVQVLIYHKSPDTGIIGSVTGFRRDVEPIFLMGEWPKRPAARSSIIASRIGLHRLAKPGLHPHVKPADVLMLLLDAMPDGILLDPFMGSGTTLRAAKDLGRKAIGIEIEEKYCEIAAKRLEQEVLDLPEGNRA